MQAALTSDVTSGETPSHLYKRNHIGLRTSSDSNSHLMWSFARLCNYLVYLVRYFDGLVQDCSNSIATHWSYCSLALSHRFEGRYWWCASMVSYICSNGTKLVLSKFDCEDVRWCVLKYYFSLIIIINLYCNGLSLYAIVQVIYSGIFGLRIYPSNETHTHTHIYIYIFL